MCIFKANIGGRCAVDQSERSKVHALCMPCDQEKTLLRTFGRVGLRDKDKPVGRHRIRQLLLRAVEQPMVVVGMH